MEKVLKELGFKRLTGPLWKHKETDYIIAISEDDKPSDLVGKLVRIGIGECQVMMKSALGIIP